MANSLIVVAGPPFGGKSRMIRARMADDPSLICIDFTGLFTALALQERDRKTGRYPVRQTGDPRLAYTAGIFYRAIEHAAFTGQRGFVTTAKRDQVERLKGLADTRRVEVVDPGVDAVIQRMRDYYEPSPVPLECSNALDGWYGVDGSGNPTGYAVRL